MLEGDDLGPRKRDYGRSGAEAGEGKGREQGQKGRGLSED